MTRLLVTGGAGFIGSAFIRATIGETDAFVLNLDALTYASSLESLYEVDGNARYAFRRVDIRDAAAVRDAMAAFRPTAIVNLAAESHVDRSIDAPAEFIGTNVVGTYTVLQEAVRYWRALDAADSDAFRFLHVSTDEVFGSLGQTGVFSEATAYDPHSPYAASKAASDHLVRAWYHTYGLPVVVTNCSNNFGPYQFPEKLIPLIIRQALARKPLPVYGRGENVRDWLYVEDHCRALHLALAHGRPGETYVVGGNGERRNIDVVRQVCDLIDDLTGQPDGASARDLIEFVTDRPGHDLRYAIDASKARAELGWAPRETLESGLRKTVEWYVANQAWCDAVSATSRYDGERLGLATTR